MGYYTPTEREAQERRDALSCFDAWNERALLAALALFGVPQRYLDLGCGTGAMVRTAQRLKADAWGVDVVAQGDGLLVADLTQPLFIQRDIQGARFAALIDSYEQYNDPVEHFDLISCIEVAEHLDAEYARTLVVSIARHSAPDGLIIFTAAQPGQPGDHHVNCQPQKYWEALFFDEGLHAHTEYTLALSLLWRYTAGALAHHLPANLTVYHNGGRAD